MNAPNRTHFNPSMAGSLFVGFYGFVVAASFGAVVLDVVYARTIRDVLDAAQSERIFSPVADFLLLPLALRIIAAVAALGYSFKFTPARNLLVASVLVMMAPLPVYVFLNGFFGSQLADSSIGAWIRLSFGGCAAVLAMAAMSRYQRGAVRV